MILWAPILQSDSRAAAQSAAKYMADSRATHFWDLWSFGRNLYNRQLNIPYTDSWDMFAVYGPGVRWEESAPEPTQWFQNRNLNIGEAYTQEKMENLLKQWAED